MKLIIQCKSCKENFRIRARAKDRFVLAKKLGKKPTLKCKYCQKSHAYVINEIKAEVNKRILMLASIILVVGTVITFLLIWDYIAILANVYTVVSLFGLLTMPYLIYEGINQEQRTNVNYFNSKFYG